MEYFYIFYAKYINYKVIKVEVRKQRFEEDTFTNFLSV